MTTSSRTLRRSLEKTLLGEEMGGFRFEAVLGKGAFGVVFRATQLAQGRTVAVKVIDPLATGDPAMAEQLRREAKNAAYLSHPHLVEPLGCTEAQGLILFAEELCEDGNVGSKVAAGPMDEAMALEVGISVAKALDHLGKSGIVHRNVKPANILVTREGTVKLGDAGFSVDPRSTRASASGSVQLVTEYLSPEQALGERLDPRSDLYSLGITLFELLTGAPPHRGATPALTTLLHVNAVVPDVRDKVPGISEKTALVLQRLTDRKREHRPLSADDARRLLEEALEPLKRLLKERGRSSSRRTVPGADGHPESPFEKSSPRLGMAKPAQDDEGGRSPLLLALIVLGGVLAVGGLFGLALYLVRSLETAPPPG